jgi:hypothetical protein
LHIGEFVVVDEYGGYDLRNWVEKTLGLVKKCRWSGIFKLVITITNVSKNLESKLVFWYFNSKCLISFEHFYKWGRSPYSYGASPIAYNELVSSIVWHVGNASNWE